MKTQQFAVHTIYTVYIHVKINGFSFNKSVYYGFVIQNYRFAIKSYLFVKCKDKQLSNSPFRFYQIPERCVFETCCHHVTCSDICMGSYYIIRQKSGIHFPVLGYCQRCSALTIVPDIFVSL